MATALEKFVENVRTLSASGNFRDLYEQIRQSEEVLVRNGAHLSTVLDSLDLQQHSLGYMGVLLAKYSIPPLNAETDRQLMFEHIQEFIDNCNGEQIRNAPDFFANLCHRLTEHLIETRRAARGILLLRRAIRKVQLHERQLTAVHADLCQLCLAAKNLKPALEFLDLDVTAISSEQGGANDSKYFLLYYYYGAMIYLALKSYERALYMLEVVITVPSVAVSHIMLEGYKKFILTSLILHGKILPVPKYTSLVVGRFLKPLSSAYHELATSQQAAVKHREIFVMDNNMGLVNQVLSTMYKKNIQRLTKTFLTLSLSDVACRVNLASTTQAEFYILSMIEDGEIYAVINQKDGMVVFEDDPETYASAETLSLLHRQMEAATKLHGFVHEMDRHIQTNPQYVKKLMGNHDDDLPATSQNSKTTYTM